MNKTIISIAIMLLLVVGVNAQSQKQVSIQLWSNHLELAYQQYILSENIWGEAFVGIANQDINNRFDDFHIGIRLGYDVFTIKRGLIGINTRIGMYIPKNDYYSAITPTIGAGFRYRQLMGKSNRHCILLNIGYQHGTHTYKQVYNSEIMDIATFGKFKLSPLCISLGYGFIL